MTWHTESSAYATMTYAGIGLVGLVGLVVALAVPLWWCWPLIFAAVVALGAGIRWLAQGLFPHPVISADHHGLTVVTGPDRHVIPWPRLGWRVGRFNSHPDLGRGSILYLFLDPGKVFSIVARDLVLFTPGCYHGVDPQQVAEVVLSQQHLRELLAVVASCAPAGTKAPVDMASPPTFDLTADPRYFAELPGGRPEPHHPGLRLRLLGSCLEVWILPTVELMGRWSPGQFEAHPATVSVYREGQTRPKPVTYGIVFGLPGRDPVTVVDRWYAHTIISLPIDRQHAYWLQPAELRALAGALGLVGCVWPG